MKLDIDVNYFFPGWDEALDNYMQQARNLISEEKYEEAKAALNEVLKRRSGAGSAEAYVLRAQTWFEDNDKYFQQALTDLGFADRLTLPRQNKKQLLEKIHFIMFVRSRQGPYLMGGSARQGTKVSLRN